MTLTTDYRTQKLQQFTIRAANSSQAEQHARAAWAIWNKGKTWEVGCKEIFPQGHDADSKSSNSGRSSKWRSTRLNGVKRLSSAGK